MHILKLNFNDCSLRAFKESYESSSEQGMGLGGGPAQMGVHRRPFISLGKQIKTKHSGLGIQCSEPVK